MSHAILSASGASRWMKCPPSARLEETLPESTSAYAEEGQIAHSLAEQAINAWLNGTTVSDAEKQKTGLANDVIEAVQIYVDLAIEKINEARARSSDAVILLEETVSYTEYAEEGFGTGDLIVISDKVMEITDLKMGKGVPVSAIGNPQMRLYGLGAYAAYGWLYDIETVRMTIVQPRLDSVSTEEMTVEDLLAWGESIKPVAAQAFAGEGEFQPGDHCRFCRAKVKCRARADQNLALVKYEFRDPKLLDDQDIAEILAQADRLQTWAKDVADYALTAALDGKEWPGWKLVEGRRVRKYTDADKVAETLLANGYPDALLFERSLLGITAMEKVVGKKKFSELLTELIETPPGKPALVPESDKRQPLDRQAATRRDFEEAG